MLQEAPEPFGAFFETPLTQLLGMRALYSIGFARLGGQLAAGRNSLFTPAEATTVLRVAKDS